MKFRNSTYEDKVKKVGHIRTMEWFAFLPVTIGAETRWLETVTVLQTYIKESHGSDGNTFTWHNTRFTTKP